MLKKIRELHSSTGTKILYSLLAASFVIWGVGSFGSDRVDLVAEVHGTRITRRELDREAALLQRRYEQLLKGVTLPNMPDLRVQALDNLIDAALVEHEVDSLGLDPTDDEILAAIQRIPELQENGRFNRELLSRILDSQRDRGEFEESIRRNLRDERLRDLASDGVTVTDAEVEERYRTEREQVTLSFVRVSAADLAKTATVSDADVEAELKAHEDRYRTPTTVRARYVAYHRDEFAALAKPSDAQVKAFYEAHVADRFTDVEEVHARHILIPLAPGADEAAKTKARAEADDVLKQVKAGGDFAALAKKHSKDPGSAEKGGDIGFFARGRMVPAFEAAAFALEPGGVTEVVETPFGFHVIKVEEKKPGGPRPFDAVRTQIEQELTAERSLDLARKQADSDRRAVVDGKALADAVGGRKVEETPPFSAGAEVPGVGRVKGFVDEALSLDEGQVSNLIETDEALYMLTPFERREPAVPPLAEIRARVEQDAKKTAGERLAKAEAEKVLASAKTVGLQKAATDAGLKVDDTGSFDRRAGSVPKVGPAPDIRADAFLLTDETPLGPRVYTVAGDAIVVAFKTKTPADMKDLETARSGIREMLLSQRRQAAVAAMMTYLKERAAKAGALKVYGDAVDQG